MSTETPRLPRGRHGLSRADVSAVQRRRIIAAMAEVMAQRGYVETPVAAVLKAAGVSRETFYQLFTSKQDCFIAAISDAIEALADLLLQQQANEQGKPPIEAFDRLLETYFSLLMAVPDYARLFLIETYAAGPEAMQHRLELDRQFIEGVATLFGETGDRPNSQVLVGSVISMVTWHFVRNEHQKLDAVRPTIVAAAARLFAAS